MHSDCLAGILKFSVHFKETQNWTLMTILNGHKITRITCRGMAIALYQKLTNEYTLLCLKQTQYLRHVYINLVIPTLTKFSINQVRNLSKLDEKTSVSLLFY